jgi:hypothetical protein
MPLFVYKVKNQKNEVLKGKVEAQSIQQASALLKEKGMFIVSLNQQGNSELAALSAMFDKVKDADVVNFTRQLYTMINARLTLKESFNILQQQSRPAMQKIVASLHREVEGGTSFAAALQKQGGAFSRVYIALVRSGESAGVLDKVLHRLADNLEKDHEFKAKTRVHWCIRDCVDCDGCDAYYDDFVVQINLNVRRFWCGTSRYDQSIDLNVKLYGFLLVSFYSCVFWWWLRIETMEENSVWRMAD